MTLATARPLTISTEARGVVRRFKVKLETQHLAFHAKFRSREMNDVAEKYRRAGKTGRERAYKRLYEAFGEPSVQVGRVSVWSYLRYRDAVLVAPKDPGQAQPAVVVNYLLAGWTDTLSRGLWTLEVPEHALGRLAQRCPGIDLETTIMEAHGELLCGNIEVLPDPDRDIAVRAGPGIFIGQMVYARDFVGRDWKEGHLVYFRPRTWMHDDQIPEERRYVMIKADPDAGRCLGAGPMLPVPLRELGFSKNSITVKRHI